MPPVSLLIKPVSGACNMKCPYCFYRDITYRRTVPQPHPMSERTLETLIMKTFAYADGGCMIAFQGGEPTLAGLPFFQKALELVQRYNVKRLPVRYAFQTNGLAVTAEWAEFFRSNRILAGLSLDGPPEIHNAHRPDSAGKPTYDAVIAAADTLSRAGANFNILTVVTNRTAERVDDVYRFFRKRRFKYLQFIPCLAPLGAPQKKPDGAVSDTKPYPLTAVAYGKFLKRLFGLWYEDLKKGRYVSIRQFDNYLSILQGNAPEACDMGGVCSVQYVAESDGSIYPCDFYALDEYRLGTIDSASFAELDAARKKLLFIEESKPPANECLACRYFTLCRGGCKRHRIMNAGTAAAEKHSGADVFPMHESRSPAPAFPRNYFCSAYVDFFDSCLPRLTEIARTR